MRQIRSSLYGAYDYKLGNDMHNILKENKEVLSPYIKEKLDVDVDLHLEKKPSCVSFDEEIGAKLNGFESPEAYYAEAGAVRMVPHIKVPTFFLNTIDDPLVHHECIDKEIIKNNSNVILGTTKYGGHIGHHESIWDLKNNWYGKIAFQFLNQYKEDC